MKSINILIIVLIVFSSSCGKKQKKEPEQTINYLEESKEAFDQRIEWWRDARFGMFIHWGVYAIPAGMYNGEEVPGIGEWIMKRGKIPVDKYEAMAKSWNPTQFDADSWVKLMKDAGMKYMVITSKHHDGFALWDSEVSDYNIVDYTPNNTDILKELSEACKKYGVRFGLYHSIMDWHHPNAQRDYYMGGKENEVTENKEDFADYYENYLKPQLKELIDNYDPEIMWFDGEWVKVYTHEQGQDLYQYVRSLKPDILINNRVDKGRKSMQGMNKDDMQYAGDFGTPEQEILEGTSSMDWESCMTMNDTWGFKKNDDNWKSTELLVHNLVDVAAKGGNYLLNIGPKADGTIPQPSVERLKAIGEWLTINGEAIYGTDKLSSDNYKQGELIRFTRKKGENLLYGITLEKPEGEINFKYLKPDEGSEVFLLGYDQPLEWNYTDKGLTVSIPADATEGLDHAWVFKVTGEEVK